jgi:hypothetical protein
MRYASFFQRAKFQRGTIGEKEPLPEAWLCVNWNLEALVGVIMGSGKGTRAKNVKFGVIKWIDIKI